MSQVNITGTGGTPLLHLRVKRITQMASGRVAETVVSLDYDPLAMPQVPYEGKWYEPLVLMEELQRMLGNQAAQEIKRRNLLGVTE